MDTKYQDKPSPMDKSPTSTSAEGQVELHDKGDDALKVRFNIWSTLGIQYSTTSTPVAIGTYLSVSVGVGGSPVFFWGYIIGVLMSGFICMSLAEMASSHPHASGRIRL